MNSAKEVRSDILEMLINVQDIGTLERIRQGMKAIFRNNEAENNAILPAFMEGVRPTRKNVSLDDLMQEQNYHRVLTKHSE